MRVDASSKLQLLAAGGEEQLVIGFDSLAVSGKSLTKLHLSTSGMPVPSLASLVLRVLALVKDGKEVPSLVFSVPIEPHGKEGGIQCLRNAL